MTERIDPAELQEQQYGAWRNHPMTRFFLQYLGDYAATLEAAVVQRWRAGQLDPRMEDEARGRVRTLLEVKEMPWAAMMQFYGLGQPSEDEQGNGKPPTK